VLQAILLSDEANREAVERRRDAEESAEKRRREAEERRERKRAKQDRRRDRKSDERLEMLFALATMNSQAKSEAVKKRMAQAFKPAESSSSDSDDDEISLDSQNSKPDGRQK